MARILTIALKDLKLLWRDRFGLFWVLAFPLLMALFFGAIFSRGGGGGAGSMKVAFVSDNKSPAAMAFYNELAGVDVIKGTWTTADSARRMVAQGKITAYVYYKDTSMSLLGLFNDQNGASVEVGIDPSRKAERGYLRGLVTQAYFTRLYEQMMELSNWIPSVDKQLTALDSTADLTNHQKTLLRSSLIGLRGFLTSVDTLDSTTHAEVEGKTPLTGVKIDFEEVAVTRHGPRSSWEITFPQSLQWALIAVTAAFAISIVVERTHGTYLRLRLAPIGRVQILAGKGLACFIAATLVCLLLLALGILVFGVHVASALHLAIAVLASGICFVGIMMFISVLGKTEQSVGGAGWAMLLVMSMIGGGMVPLFFMPKWMSTIGSISAVKWSILALEGAIWRGFSTNDMILPVSILLGYGTLFFLVGVLILRRTEK